MAKITLTKDLVFQEFNLNEIFGIDLSGHPDIGLSFGQAVIDKILERTKKGKDINGQPFTGYDDDYINSLKFDAFGKTKKVNMDLEGNMLSSIDIMRFNGRDLRIGFDGLVENNKAYNHNVGDTLPERAFFGVKDEDIEELRREFQPQIDSIIQNADESDLFSLLTGSALGSQAEQTQDILNELSDDFFGSSGSDLF